MAAKSPSRQSIPVKEQKLLCMMSGGVCAFPGCGKPLVEPGKSPDDPAILGEIAHIVADSRQGPRGDSDLTDEARDRHPNLILLCGDHHTVIDAQPNTYSVAVLRQMKADHEARVRRGVSGRADDPEPVAARETIHSSLLPVTHLPAVVFAAPCAFGDRQDARVKERVSYPADRDELCPFLLREGKLIAFHDLRDAGNPFANVTDRRLVERLRAEEMWDDDEGMRRYVALLNRALFKYTGRLRLRYDPAHFRFYFEAERPGRERAVTYRPLNATTATRNVVWQPVRKSTGEKKPFWWHLAAGLRFHRVGPREWCLTVRPERHLTADGATPLQPKQIGRKVSSLKARMFNDLYLSEVNFWKEFLSQGNPRIILKFGSQAAVVDAQFVTFDVAWPGIPGDDRPFTNQAREDDLFTLGDLRDAVGGEDAGWDDPDDEDADGRYEAF